MARARFALSVSGLLAAGLAALGATAPLASQRTADAALEAACRATEVTEPGSCACTIREARGIGISEPDLASLFKDDGHSQPVDQAVYGRFWQVKAQCIAETTMARMGISASNPLPGVPAHMRPGAPLGGAPAPNAPATAPSAPTRAAAPQSDDCTGYGGEGYDKFCGEAGPVKTVIEYDRRIAQYPDVQKHLDNDTGQFFRGYLRAGGPPRPYAVGVIWTLEGTAGRLASLVGASGEQSRGRYESMYDLLWDRELGREIFWRDVFGERAWKGFIKTEYCAALRQRMAESTGYADRLSQCPDLDRLVVALREDATGGYSLIFSAVPGVIAPYATSALYDGIMLPLEGDLLAAVSPAYRASLGATGAGQSTPKRFADRLGEVILGPPMLAQSPECVTEFYLQPAEIGNPRGIEDIRMLIELSPRLIMITNAGMLGGDDWRSGIALNGRFVDLEQGPWDERLQRHTYSGAGMAIHYEERQAWSEVSYGGWGHGDLVIREGGEIHRVPVLQQSWQCT